MTIRWIALMALALSVGSGCTSPSATSTDGVRDHMFKTSVGCVRKERTSQFDSRCDMPLLGYGGFNAP